MIIVVGYNKYTGNNMILFFSIFFVLYSALNYYIFIRGWQALAVYPHLRIIYLILFIITAFSYILAKLLESHLSHWLYDLMIWVGSFWFAFMLYFFISVLLIDVVRLLNWKFDFFPALIKNNYETTKQITLLVVVILSSLIVLYGFINTRMLSVKNLKIKLPKGKSALTNLNAVMVADVHLSPINGEKLLQDIAAKINSLKPDIVFIAGDLVDDKAKILKDRGIGPALKTIKSKYGVYAINGNHEFINGYKQADKFMENFGIILLRDTSVLVGDGFYVIGRDDRSIKQFTGQERKNLDIIMQETDKQYPKILMDHTPFGLNEAENNGIDLQLSGHTHNGQLFPANLITKMIYEVSWGYLRKGNTQYYVTCGVGTWGPPVRTGSKTEIVNIKIDFE